MRGKVVADGVSAIWLGKHAGQDFGRKRDRELLRAVIDHWDAPNVYIVPHRSPWEQV